MLKKILIVLFFQSIIFIAGAQTALEFIVTPYNKINGISTKSISDILQGSEGYIWIGSSQGLIRFDGNTFKTITNEPGFSNSINNVSSKPFSFGIVYKRIFRNQYKLGFRKIK